MRGVSRQGINQEPQRGGAIIAAPTAG